MTIENKKLNKTFKGFFRNLYKVIKWNRFYNYNLRDIDLKEEINIIILNFISLSNDGQYQRFNSYDFYSKSSKIKLICSSIAKLQAYRDQFPNERKQIQTLLKYIGTYFNNLEKPLDKIFEIIDKRTCVDKVLFIEIRNLIVSEWVSRNILDEKSCGFKLKDLNYLNYTIDEYQVYLHNCFNLLIRDTKKFISRYPLEYKINPDIDLEIMMSLKDSIYNDIKIITPNDNPENNSMKDFNIFEIISKIENPGEETEPKLILRGWFKNKPNNCKIDIIKYKAYKKSFK
jgi:hypothetical protein